MTKNEHTKFDASKDIINRGKRQGVAWQKRFVNHTSYKGLMCRIYTEILEVNNNKKKKTSNSDKTWEEGLNDIASKINGQKEHKKTLNDTSQ